MKRRGVILATGAALAAATLAAPLAGQSLIDRLYNEAKAAAERRAREALRQPSAAPAPSNSTSAPAARGTPGTVTTSATAGPTATTRVVSVPQNLWLDLGRGKKFMAPEGKPQIIATNPYIAPDKFMFASISDIDCLPDGSLVVGGEGFQNGDANSYGLWRVAADGAVTRLATTPWGEASRIPYQQFSVTADGGVISVNRYALFRLRGAVVTRIAGQPTETKGNVDGRGSAAMFSDPDAPIEDSAGNIWLVDQNGCSLRRITPDGEVTTVIGPGRSACQSTLPPGDRVVLSTIAWDKANGEIVAGGSTIVGRPTHDMHVSVWRIKPDGQARRVFYTLKNGRSPVGQNTDHIWSVAVDPAGAIVVGTRFMNVRARRQIMRVDEKAQRLIPLTGQAFGDADYRPGHEEAPYDGPAQRASFRDVKRMCFGPGRTLFVLDDHLVRRLNADGTVRSWIY